jgi:hypothetical protein
MERDSKDIRIVPKDFPVTVHLSAIAGAQPKIGLIEEEGRFYAPGTSPSEVDAAFRMCEDLALQMVAYCQRKLASFNGDKGATVKSALDGLLAKRWCTDEQCVWIMRRVVDELKWSVTECTWRL